MKNIKAEAITDTIKKLCIEANCELPCDAAAAIEAARACEPFETARTVLAKISENYHVAREERMPICQDTGLACVFLEIGQDVHIEGDLRLAADEGVRRGYAEGFFAKVVRCGSAEEG